MEKRLVGALVISAATLCMLCGTPATATEKTTIVALVAANAKAAFGDVAKAYEKAHPDVMISATYAGSKIIAAQIANGAAADIVIMSQPAVAAAGAGLDSPIVIFKNRTAIGVNKSGAEKIHDARDLAKPGLRLVGGTPGSIVAGYQNETVEKMTAHYGKDFAGKYAANVIDNKTDTNKVVEMVEAGAADAALLFESNIDTAKLMMIKLGDQDEVVVLAVVASVKASTHATQAKDLVKFVAGPQAAAIFRHHRQETP